VTSESRRPRVAFFGSGAFGVPILESLAAMPDVDLVAVLSVPDRPSGRSARAASPPVAARARELGLAMFQPERLRDPETLARLSALDLDAAVLADYGRIVPGSLLRVPRRGFLNVHPSSLPRHRGATPIQATLLAGDARAAVTLFEMDEGLDTGPIVAQLDWPLSGTETGAELEAEAAIRGAGLLGDTLGPWLAGDRPAWPQAAAGVTTTRPLQREDGRLDPARPAEELARQVRALTPWPGTFIETSAGRLLVLSASAAEAAGEDRPGLLVPDDGGLALTTGAGRLRLLEVRPAGGRSMSGAELRRGRPQLEGTSVLGAPALTGSAR
jgi:methionyl-tRNA formyltransferase